MIYVLTCLFRKKRKYSRKTSTSVVRLGSTFKQVATVAFKNSHLVEVRVVEHMMSVDVAPRDLDVHVSVRVEAIDDGHRLSVLGVDLTRNVLDLHLCLPMRRDLQLGGLASDHLFKQGPVGNAMVIMSRVTQGVDHKY